MVFGYFARAAEQPDLIVKGIPTPAQMIRVVSDIPMSVPAGKRFVATGLGTTHGELTSEVLIDGQLLLKARLDNMYGYVIPIPPGMAARAGSIVKVKDNVTPSDAVLLGYLADA